VQTILNFLIKHNHWFLLLLLEGISFVLIISFNNYQSATVFTSANNIAGNAYGILSDVNSYFGLKEKNDELFEYNRLLLNELEQTKEELKKYKDSTSVADNGYIQNNRDGYFYLTACVVNNNLNKVNNFVTIDKGEKDGILSEMGVFNSQGVVGIVYSTSENFALVIPLLNSKSNISCRVKGTNSYSRLQWNGGDARYSYLVDLPRYAVFEKGDTVVTSGFSSIFPAGVPVGVIDNLEDAEDGLFFKARVELFVDFSSIENLFVVGNNKKEEQELLEKTIEKE
jgi:rod shape-determining protein MreC